MAKLQEVADRAGVSIATASRVLAGTATVSAAARERVLHSAAALDYRPNRLASSLTRQKTERIVIVVSDIENPHFTEMVRFVEGAAFRRGFRVVLCNTDELVDRQEAYLEVLAADRVEGIILAPADPISAGVVRLLDMGIPVVAFDRAVADPRADAVVADNADGARRATEHLLDAGHTRIGFVGGRPEIQTGRERLAGYEEAMRSRGLSPRVVGGGFRIEGGEVAAQQLLDPAAALTALVVGNNLMAIGALRAIRGRSLRVPEDLALVAIDDPFWATLVDPPLTTFAQPVDEMARAAVELLFERIGTVRTAARSVTFPFDLRIRASCGALTRRQPGRLAGATHTKESHHAAR